MKILTIFINISEFLSNFSTKETFTTVPHIRNQNWRAVNTWCSPWFGLCWMKKCCAESYFEVSWVPNSPNFARIFHEVEDRSWVLSISGNTIFSRLFGSSKFFLFTALQNWLDIFTVKIIGRREMISFWIHQFLRRHNVKKSIISIFTSYATYSQKWICGIALETDHRLQHIPNSIYGFREKNKTRIKCKISGKSLQLD